MLNYGGFMKILVFDIGGTSIKYGICIDDVLHNVKETPTNAKLGGRHIVETLISLIKEQSDYDAIGISTAGQVNSKEGYIIYANQNIPNYTGTKIKEELDNLRPSSPTTDTEEKTYHELISVSVNAGNNKLYVNPNGEYPSVGTHEYTGPISLTEGEKRHDET